MEEQHFYVVEWRIENLSRWREKVHGHCIQSPEFGVYFGFMELYPKGVNGQGERLVVRFKCTRFPFSGELSIYSSDRSLLCEQRVNAKGNENLELPPGPEFDDVLSRIREDFITLRLRIEDRDFREERMCTTINVFRVDLEISPKWIMDGFESGGNKSIVCIETDNFERLWLESCFKNNKLLFSIQPIYDNAGPFAVEMSLKRSTVVDSCVQREHVFLNNDDWTFPDSLEKEELVGKGISLLLSLTITTSKLSWSKSINYDRNDVSLVPINTFPPTEDRRLPTGPHTSCKTDDDSATVLTKDSGSQTSSTSDDSVLVLSRELMCLYQDQDFSDITLKCGNVSFPVHKGILSARSPVFKTMLSTDMTEAASGQVVVEDLDPSTLSLFLAYLYTGTVEDLECDRALKLYYAADKYQVPSLKGECRDFLCSEVSISNVCDILTLADKHRDDKLTTASHDFILDNYNAVLKSKEWETLKKSDPLLVANTLTQFAAEDHVVRKPHLQ